LAHEQYFRPKPPNPQGMAQSTVQGTLFFAFVESQKGLSSLGTAMARHAPLLHS
jgi:hypothetical protein